MSSCTSRGIAIIGAFTLIPSMLSAQPGIDLARFLLSANSVKGDLEKYQTAFEYATGLADDITNGRTPRKPQAFEFTKTADRLSSISSQIQKILVPSPVNPEDSQYKVGIDAITGTPAQKQDAASKLIAYNRAMRSQLMQMASVAEQLDQIQVRAAKLDNVCVVLSKTFSDLAANPVVTAFFQEMFAYQWLDVELTILPQVREIKSRAIHKAKEIRDEAKQRRVLLDNHTANLQSILPLLGVSVPSDIH